MGKTYSKKYVLLFAFLMLSIMAFAQSGSISGKIVDEHNQPLPGATLTIDGTTLGGAADANGNYKITGIKPGTYTVRARFVGYDDVVKSISVNGPVTLPVNMLPSNKSLSEVVVIGYGTQRKKDLTGSVVAVTSKDFNQGPITTPEQLIQGKVSGVQITSNSGSPGSGSTIRIRGGASLNASNDPLIVIDGVPISNTSINGVANALSLINPNDIESFNILKDASATAIYGSRASNGVLIITTKKGGANAPFTANFSSLNSLSVKTKEVDVLSADQFRDLVTANGGASQVALLGKSNTNWQDQIYQTAFGTDNNISFSGGIKGLPYRLSVGYLDQDGILKTDNFKRTTAALNLNHGFLRNSLKVDVNLKGTYTNSVFAQGSGAIGAAISFDPTQPVYSGNSKYGGYYEWLDASGNPNTLAPRNPLGLLEQRQDTGTGKRGIGNASFNYTLPFFKDVQLNANVGFDVSDGAGQTYVPATAAAFYTQKGTLSHYFQENTNYVTDYYAKYAHDFKDIKSHVDFTAGYSYQYYSFYTRAQQGYAADGVTTVGLPSNPTKPQYYVDGFFGRLNYSFNDRYLLTATIRDDRSSRFSDLHRNGYFPSVALAWRLKEEDFLKGADFLSDLKLRVGYGVTGQQDIASNNTTNNSYYFPYLARYSPSNGAAAYQFGNTYINTLRAEAYNQDLKWETTSTSNVAIDYGFLNGRISGSLEYYYRKTKDLLVDTPIPDGTNLTNHLYANVGDLNTKGVDFNVNINAVNTKDFRWDIGYNVSFNKIKVTNISLTGDPNQIVPVGTIGGGVGNTIQLLKAGATPYAFYVYQQVYGATGTPLEGVYVDRNQSGSTADDKYLYQQPNPKVFMGFNTSVTYKKWTASTSLRANIGNYVYNNVAASTGAYAGFKFSGYLGNLSSSVLDTKFNNYQLFSDYYVQNASFVRMDNANLSYNFGKVAKTATLRVTGNVSNVFVITKYKGLDPEVQGGIDNNFYPRPRVFSLGVNLGF
ncbi:SusC/RagA family TonB-linked outer membrane protein [Mucilaginibacter agri]|uniref:SusC/RagA family TonB-linked outer membrane protein n=1 Tax=Mucilaginibacter agri TaxID=2695265 RepID=A0A966DUR6_9SPHI|nr:SusC/RagA family TonB-linked outer membrane protein [Mucilaginibacter agri]NCD69864.1 SusC/RagA family TonB-linked outer membrane protein [Mucilaginibacter agri]